MKFLTYSDLYLSIEQENIDEITNCKTYLVDEAEQRALESTKEYLRGRFDIEYELRSYSTSGISLQNYERYKDVNDVVSVWDGTSSTFLTDDRNYSLKCIVLDLLKYELFQRVAPRQLSQIVVDRYDRAITKLTNINKGLLTMNLKTISDTNEQNYYPFRYGNNEWSNKYKW